MRVESLQTAPLPFEPSSVITDEEASAMLRAAVNLFGLWKLTDKQAAVTILQRRMLSAVDLVKALGGGWDASTLPSTDQLRSAELASPDNTQKVAQPVSR